LIVTVAEPVPGDALGGDSCGPERVAVYTWEFAVNAAPINNEKAKRSLSNFNNGSTEVESFMYADLFGLEVKEGI